MPEFLIKNKWGRVEIKLYVDTENRPRFAVFGQMGNATVYELKLAAAAK